VAGWARLDALTEAAPEHRADLVATLLGVESWTRRTRSALDRAAHDPRALVSAAACAPEYVVSL
jgi:hypothetical protein